MISAFGITHWFSKAVDGKALVAGLRATRERDLSQAFRRATAHTPQTKKQPIKVARGKMVPVGQRR